MLFLLKISFRLFQSSTKFNKTAILAIVGLILAVACLVVSMAVISGFEQTLKKAVVDTVGHITLVRRGGDVEIEKFDLERWRKINPEIHAVTPFLHVESIVAHKGSIAGILLEGIDSTSVDRVLDLRSRIIKGRFELMKNSQGFDGALVGKGIAQKLHLNLNDTFKVVIPVGLQGKKDGFHTRTKNYSVSGVLDLGKHDYNERFIVVEAESTQEVLGRPVRYTGVRMRIEHAQRSRSVAEDLTAELGPQFWSKDWQDVNYNLMNAIQFERMVIFLILLILIIAACFNISSTLFVHVLKRYADISILKTIGARPRTIVGIFMVQGFVLGMVGVIGGSIAGFGLCQLFLFAQKHWQLLPGEIYKLDYIAVQNRPEDLAAIFIATLAVCLISTLIPAIRGARLEPVTGLRYE